MPMARAIWSGTLSFGLVSIPVKLYPAVRRRTVRFHQLDGADHARIQQRRVSSRTGEEVPYERLVKGYELSPDRYVVITQEELDALDPRRTHQIEIEDFVDAAAIDPIYFDATYHVAPGAGGSKPYRLLMEAMRATGRAGIARVVLRTKEYMVVLRPAGESLELTTMLFADEIVDPSGLEELAAAVEAKTTKRELDVAAQLVESLATDWDPSRYRDDYRERVLDLVERKAQGEEIEVIVEPEAQPTPVPDLMSALKASLDAVRERQAPAPAKRRREPAAGRAAGRERGAPSQEPATAPKPERAAAAKPKRAAVAKPKRAVATKPKHG